MNYTISFNELNSIIPKLQGGDTVYINNGIYYDQKINITTIATPEKRLYIKAQNPGKVVFSNTLDMIISGSYITVSGFTFENGGNSNAIQLRGTGNRITNCNVFFNNAGGPVISIFDTKNRIDHCLFENFDKAGVWLEIKRNDELNYSLVDHNIFRNRALGNGNGFETIRIGLSTDSLSNSRSIIMSNIFENCNGELELISSKSSENIIHNNIIKNSKGTITLRHGNRSIVSKNKFIQNGVSNTGGIRIMGEDHVIYNNLLTGINGGSAISISNGIKNSRLNGYFQVKRLQIIKNILINNMADFTIGVANGGRTLPPILSEISDNIVYKNNNNTIFNFNGFGSPDMYYSNNFFYGYNMGKTPFIYDALLDPSTFNLNIINYEDYGTTDITGPLFNIEPEMTEIPIELNYNYNKIKAQILTELYVQETNVNTITRRFLSNDSSHLSSNFVVNSLIFFYVLNYVKRPLLSLFRIFQ